MQEYVHGNNNGFHFQGKLAAMQHPKKAADDQVTLKFNFKSNCGSSTSFLGKGDFILLLDNHFSCYRIWRYKQPHIKNVLTIIIPTKTKFDW